MEAGVLGIPPTSLRLGAGEPPVGLPQWGSNWAVKWGLKPGKDGAGLVPPGGVRTERPCALCLLKMELGC